MNCKITVSVLLLVLLGLTNVYGQECDCESNFKWMKKTFEENDAGFQYIIDKKGQQAYDIHNTLYADKIKSAKTPLECTTLLYEWLEFFRSGHIGIERLVADNSGIASSQSVEPKEDYETVDIDILQFESYLSSKNDVDYEGVWETGLYKIGVKKDREGYVGFIIESSVDTWKEGQVKLKIANNGGKQSSTFYLRDHSPEDSGEPEMLGKNYLQMGRFLLKRLSPIYPADQAIESYFKMINADNPYFEELSSTTLYLRIPSFDTGEKKKIDSVIFANKEKILQTENLIIDLRNNGGGSDGSYSELIPFLYTNPIRTVGVEFLSTKQNNQRMLDFANDTEYGLSEETKKWAKESYNKLEKHLNEFVNLNSDIISIDKRDTVYAYPKNIGIIINDGNASTTEQFLLAAKQSKKVKLFGTTTSGALDVSNMFSVESPCKEFRLWYCLSKSYRIPGMTIDDIGLQPDYYLDKSIPEYEWVDFVSNILNQ